MFGKVFTEKVTLEKRAGKRMFRKQAVWTSAGRVFQADGKANAEPLRQEHGA